MIGDEKFSNIASVPGSSGLNKPGEMLEWNILFEPVRVNCYFNESLSFVGTDIFYIGF